MTTSAGIEQTKAGERITEGDPHPPSFMRRSLDLTEKFVPVVILAVCRNALHAWPPMWHWGQESGFR
jgi:hypothetical protein